MLASITPLGSGDGTTDSALTATAYVVGATLGGLTLGAVAGVVGWLLHPSAAVAAVGVALVALAAVGADLWLGRRLPSIHRQVNEDWLTTYRGWVYGVGFGYQLGLGVATIVTTAAVYAAAADAVLTASVAGGVAIGAVFGLTRGLTVFLGAGVERPEQLTRIHRAFAARARTAVPWATVVVQVLVFGAATSVLLGSVMTVLDQSGITVDLPAGWEGRIYRRSPDAEAIASGVAGRNNTVMHVANFPLPPEVADYGGGAVEVMTNRDLLVVLCEFGSDSVGQALFAPQGKPHLTPDDFGTQSMQRVIEGQGGAQKFFTEAGRPFCLYVVLGSYARRGRTLPLVNDVIDAITIV